MNPVSFRTRNQNLLRTKTKSFKDNIKQTEARVRSSSSLNNLAGKLYSQQTNKDFAPVKPANYNLSRVQSSSKLEDSSFNPEAGNSTNMSGLYMRASHVPCFAELNTDLLKQKKMLESRINSLKEAIALQKRTLNRADTTARKNEAGFNNLSSLYNECHRKSQALQHEINLTNQDNSNLKQNLKNLKQNINQKNMRINQENENCNRLETETKNLKINLMHEDKQKNNLKAELSKQQRVMASYSIECKELENQRAMMLVEINHSVKSFKL